MIQRRPPLVSKPDATRYVRLRNDLNHPGMTASLWELLRKMATSKEETRVVELLERHKCDLASARSMETRKITDPTHPAWSAAPDAGFGAFVVSDVEIRKGDVLAPFYAGVLLPRLQVETELAARQHAIAVALHPPIDAARHLQKQPGHAPTGWCAVPPSGENGALLPSPSSSSSSAGDAAAVIVVKGPAAVGTHAVTIDTLSAALGAAVASAPAYDCDVTDGGGLGEAPSDRTDEGTTTTKTSTTAMRSASVTGTRAHRQRAASRWMVASQPQAEARAAPCLLDPSAKGQGYRLLRRRPHHRRTPGAAAAARAAPIAVATYHRWEPSYASVDLRLP